MKRIIVILPLILIAGITLAGIVGGLALAGLQGLPTLTTKIIAATTTIAAAQEVHQPPSPWAIAGYALGAIGAFVVLGVCLKNLQKRLPMKPTE
jgi:hypothetical protein